MIFFFITVFLSFDYSSEKAFISPPNQWNLNWYKSPRHQLQNIRTPIPWNHFQNQRKYNPYNPYYEVVKHPGYHPKNHYPNRPFVQRRRQLQGFTPNPLYLGPKFFSLSDQRRDIAFGYGHKELFQHEKKLKPSELLCKLFSSFINLQNLIVPIRIVTTADDKDSKEHSTGQIFAIKSETMNMKDKVGVSLNDDDPKAVYESFTEEQKDRFYENLDALLDFQAKLNDVNDMKKKYNDFIKRSQIDI